MMPLKRLEGVILKTLIDYYAAEFLGKKPPMLLYKTIAANILAADAEEESKP